MNKYKHDNQRKKCNLEMKFQFDDQSIFIFHKIKCYYHRKFLAFDTKMDKIISIILMLISIIALFANSINGGKYGELAHKFKSN